MMIVTTPTGLKEGRCAAYAGKPFARSPNLPDVATTRLMIADAESVLGWEHRQLELMAPRKREDGR